MRERPNIVMMSWDSVRADHMPIYGYERDTAPFVDEQAELVFENTHVAGVGTPTSFTGIFTGEHASGVQTNADPKHWIRANKDRKFLQEYLQEEGYYTGGFHFNALMSRHFGWNRGWDVYEDHMWDEGGGISPGDDNDENLKTKVYNLLQRYDLANFAVHLKKIVVGDAPEPAMNMWEDISNFIEKAPEPWFLWILLIDTHHPYFVPENHQEWTQYGIRMTYAMNFTMRRHRNWVGPRQQKIVNSYDNTIRYADWFTKQVWEKLVEEGYEDDPFIVHSDHGDEMGEHANYGHRPLMYNTVTRVPLVMWNVNAEGRIGGPNSLLGLGNAVLNIAGSDVRMGVEQDVLADEKKPATIQNLLDEERCAAVVDDEWKVLFHPEGDWGHGGHIVPGTQAYTVNDILEDEDRYGEHPSYLEDILNEMKYERIETTGGTISGDLQERLAELGYME